jgi:V8-like Glu-specific endopeptidase
MHLLRTRSTRLLAGLFALAASAAVHAAEAPVYKDWNDLLRNAPAAPEPQPEWRRTPIGQPPTKTHGAEKDMRSGELHSRALDAVPALLAKPGRVAGFPGEIASSSEAGAAIEGLARMPGDAASGKSMPVGVDATPPGPDYFVRDYPWRTVYKLLMRFGNYWFVCSAETFDSFHLMTAGHCLYNFDPNQDGDTSDQQWADEVWAFPAQTDLVPPSDEADQPFGEARATRLRSWSCWTDDGDWDCDWGFLTLDRAMGDRVGWMGRQWGIEESNVNFSGYPVQQPYVPAGTLVQYPGYDAGNAHDYTDYRIPMYAYTYGGHSGGPVWRYVDGDRYIIGTNSTSDRNGNAEATRYTSDEENYFTSSASSDLGDIPPASLPDLGEEFYFYESTLKALYTPTVGRRGEISFGYNVANNGWAASGDIEVDFYAASDTNIWAGDIYLGSDFLPSLDAYQYGQYSGFLRLPASVTPGQYHIGWIMSAQTEYGGMDYCGGWRSYCNNYGVIADLLEVTWDSGFNWTVSASASSGGSISPGGALSIEDGLSTSFTLTPDPGYAIDSVGGSCGGNLSGNVYTTFAIDADCSVEASFVELPDDVIFANSFE